jgi:hypothetical protein
MNNDVILLGDGRGGGGTGASVTITDSGSDFLFGWSEVAHGGSTWADTVFLASPSRPFSKEVTFGERGDCTSFASGFA